MAKLSNKKNKRTSKQKGQMEFSKKVVSDIRYLLWFVTISGVLLAAVCIYKDYAGSLPWITSMVALPWSAHGVICSFYLNMAKSDHSVGGITYEQMLIENNMCSGYNPDAPKI